MKEYFTLDKQERIQRLLMLVSYNIFRITAGLLLFYVLRHSKYVQALLPALFISLGCYYLVRGWNGFTKGSLIVKYTAWNYAQIMQKNFTKRFSSPDKARATTAKALGVLSLLMASVCFFFGLLMIVKG